MPPIFGIDLGTTNSCISLLQGGKSEVVHVDGSPLVPSVVSLDGESVIVGQRARNRAALHPGQTVASVKRRMGEPGPIMLDNRAHTPEQVSAYILGYLKDQAAKILDLPVEDVVITVPAYFSDSQRRATRTAGELAGLNVQRIINEPSAAALFYNQLQLDAAAADREQLALVYDLGGGTFDVSVLRVGEITEVLASTGNTRLGGDDFDQKVLDYCVDHIKTRHQVDPRPHPSTMARLLAAAERAKIALSTAPYAVIEEALLPVDQGKTVDISLELSRDRFEDMIHDYLEATRAEVRKALDEARLDVDGIDQVLLVGGCTRIPAVVRLLDEMFGEARKPPVDPDLCVAKGAAIQGAIISGETCEHVFIDVTAHTLGTMAIVDPVGFTRAVVPIIPRNTQVPVKRSDVFYTMVHNQQRIEVTVHQGESRDPEECELIGKIMVSMAPAPAGCPIIIEYAYDLDGIVHVKVEQKGFSVQKEADLDSRQRGQLIGEFHDEDDVIDINLGDDEEEVEGEREPPSQVLNYILQKARKSLKDLEDSPESRKLAALISEYEQALQAGDDDAVESVEERLLDLLDELTDA